MACDPYSTGGEQSRCSSGIKRGWKCLVYFKKFRTCGGGGSFYDIMPSLKDLSVLESYRNTDDFFGGQSVTRLLNGFASVVPTVNYGSKTYEIEDILESEFQNELSNGNMDSCLKRVQMKAEAVARE